MGTNSYSNIIKNDFYKFSYIEKNMLVLYILDCLGICKYA